MCGWKTSEETERSISELIRLADLIQENIAQSTNRGRTRNTVGNGPDEYDNLWVRTEPTPR